MELIENNSKIEILNFEFLHILFRKKKIINITYNLLLSSILQIIVIFFYIFY